MGAGGGPLYRAETGTKLDGGEESMRNVFCDLAEVEIEKDLRPFYKARPVVPPKNGWLRELRQISGVACEDIAERLNISTRALHKLEQAEADGTITLKTLRKVAEAMECQVVYGVVWRERPLFSKGAEMGVKASWSMERKPLGRRPLVQGSR